MINSPNPLPKTKAKKEEERRIIMILFLIVISTPMWPLCGCPIPRSGQERYNFRSLIVYITLYIGSKSDRWYNFKGGSLVLLALK